MVFRYFERFSEVLSETLSESDFPFRGSQLCCPYSCFPLNFLQNCFFFFFLLGVFGAGRDSIRFWWWTQESPGQCWGTATKSCIISDTYAFPWVPTPLADAH